MAGIRAKGRSQIPTFWEIKQCVQLELIADYANIILRNNKDKNWLRIIEHNIEID